MKVDVNEDGVIRIKELYNEVILETNEGETLAICMRDFGFEFIYQDRWYEVKEGVVKENKSKRKFKGLKWLKKWST